MCSICDDESRSRGIAVKHALSIDVEEWYHGYYLNLNPRTGSCDHQKSFEARVEGNTEIILDLLASYGVKATFFVCGEIADRHAGLVRRISQTGHEIGAHGQSHAFYDTLSRDECRTEIERSIGSLANITGKKIEWHRAPRWSIMTPNLWVLDLLADFGITADSSIYPCRTPWFGISGYMKDPHRLVLPDGRQLIEFPPGVIEANLGMKHLARLPVGGGLFLRTYPFFVTSGYLASRERIGLPGLIYLHPWEVDPHPPSVDLPLASRLSYSAMLRSTLGKLEALVQWYTFTTMSEALRQLEHIPILTL